MEISQVGGKYYLTSMTNTDKVNTAKTVTEKVEESFQHVKNEQLNLERNRIEHVVDGMNDFLLPMNVSIKFEFHEELDRYYVKVVDSETEDVVREIPSEEFLNMYASMAEFMGLFVDKKI
ncbi:flagellar protein FlaG [Bacillus sp. FJAT-45066]|uniref:flagellar protein FlaG n=1 Tax=Bacillus sp. FJAT-45066 TaxID=2011010 RepID=UPI000BB7C8D4|nr:flagellar protein FlaG [Bacillus sp. FJAT-45066]